MKKLGSLFILTLAGVLLTGCFVAKRGTKFDARAYRNTAVLTNLTEVETTNKLDGSWLRPSTNYFTLGPGDRLEIEIIGDPASRAIVPVQPDGRVYFYLLPGVDVWGLTLDQARERLQEEMKAYLTAPTLSVQLRGIDSNRVWVMGRVASPGVYPMMAPMTLLEVLSMAGGSMTSSESGTTEDLADLQHSFLIREGQRLPVNFARLLEEGDMNHNVYLQPDDFIYLPSSLQRDIYILGAVRTPRAVPRQHSTLVAAIAEAGGPIKNAHLGQVAIVRGSLDNPKIATVDYNDIIKGKAPDVLLEPRDIVYVPFSPYRFLNKYLDLILTTFVRAVAINEGARAAEPNAAPAGVSIGVVGAPGTIIGPGGQIFVPAPTTGGGTGTP